jgi:hypothetical protein
MVQPCSAGFLVDRAARKRRQGKVRFLGLGNLFDTAKARQTGIHVRADLDREDAAANVYRNASGVEASREGQERCMCLGEGTNHCGKIKVRPRKRTRSTRTFARQVNLSIAVAIHANSGLLESGKSRTRFPVAAKIALQNAATNGGTPGSPTPAGGAELSVM